MNRTTCDQTQTASAPTQGGPNYDLFRTIQGQETKLTWLACSLDYLRELEFGRLAFVLTMASLTTVGVCLAWPLRELQPAGAVAACIVTTIAGSVGLAVILTERGEKSASDRKTQKHPPGDA